MSNKNKYVATIMNRHYIADGIFVFSAVNAVVGIYNEDEEIFMDKNGNEYVYMMSEEALTSEVPYSYFNLVEINKLKDILDMDLQISSLISEYEDMCRKIIYHVGYTKDYIPYIYSFNTEKIKNEVSSLVSDTIEESLDGEMTEGLGQLIIDAIDDKYTKQELEDIVENLKTVEDELENTVGTLETKIEAIDNNQSFSECLQEKLKNPTDVEKSPKIISNKEKLIKNIKENNKKETIEVKAKETKPDEKIEVKKENRIDIKEVFKSVTKTLIAQDEPAKRVITEIARKEMDERKKKEGILLTGPTGVGKTELMRLIAKYINKPFIKIDSTQLTVPGYTGKDIEEALWDLYVKCGKDKEKTENAIVYFDEIDKKGSEKKNDVNGKGVLNVLLPFIEGSTYDAAPDSKSSSPKVKIDTTKMTVILGGAYTDVYKHLAEKNTIGFGTEKVSIAAPKYRKAETKDFVEYGQMTDEFMGRVTVVKLNDLDLNSIKRVMLESDESAMRIQKEIFEKLGVQITFTDGYINKVAENALAKKTGARGLNGIIDESTWKAFEEVYTNDGVYSEVILDEKTVSDNSSYQLIKKKIRSN